jgi:hypothetical protein
MAYRGTFIPKHPQKYAGDIHTITYRSLWERRFMKYCDETPGILKWSSEELIIGYISPVDGRPHRYFPDFLIEVNSTSGRRHFLIEVKPKKQSMLPKVPKKKTRKYIAEVATFAVNQAKWQAAQEFCRKRGWTFLVLTEEHLFGTFKNATTSKSL